MKQNIKVTEFDFEAGKRLKALRKEHGLSLNGMANILGVTHQQVNKYEKAQTRLPAQSIAVICQVFELSADYFFDGVL